MTPAARSDADEVLSPAHDPINRPRHYTAHPSGVECIQVTEHLNFCVGNAIKYLWRAGLKGPDAIEDLQKARWYIDREIKRLEGDADPTREELRAMASPETRTFLHAIDRLRAGEASEAESLEAFKAYLRAVTP